MKKINVKHGVLTKILPSVSLCLIIISIITCAMGVFGLGSAKSKAERERTKFLSKPYIQETIDALIIVDMNIPSYSSIKSITHLERSTYFSVIYINNSKEKKKYYDFKTQQEISNEIWVEKVGKILSYLLYIGETSENVTVTISGEDLEKCLREVHGEEWH